MGEYAAQSDKVVSVLNRNNLDCALAEAAFLTGLERNADVVTMSSYAPLFGHEEGWQWRPNLIWCDNLRSYGTPSYYVQQLFSRNRGDRILPVQIDGQPPATAAAPGLYASAVRDDRTGEVILKVVNSAATDLDAYVDLAGTGRVRGSGRAMVLTSGALADENSLAEPRKVAPVESRFRTGGTSWKHRFSGGRSRCCAFGGTWGIADSK
jgi:alpha-N-arabinofuranosidase